MPSKVSGEIPKELEVHTLVSVQKDTLVGQLLVVRVGKSSSLVGVLHHHHNEAYETKSAIRASTRPSFKLTVKPLSRNTQRAHRTRGVRHGRGHGQAREYNTSRELHGDEIER